MTAPQSAGTPPDARADRAPPRRGRRRPAVRWIGHGVLFVALAAGVFALLPRLGGLKHDAAGLRHARQAFLAAAIVAQGKAKESLRRHGLADSIPRIDFHRARYLPARETLFRLRRGCLSKC
jgi:hypothetical protein